MSEGESEGGRQTGDTIDQVQEVVSRGLESEEVVSKLLVVAFVDADV